MQLQQKTIVLILVSISITGVIGIQIGNPKFIANAIVLESTFVVLTALSFWRLRYTLIPNMIVAIIVIIGNTASPKHLEIMNSFEPLENAFVLIVGGYVLQGLLLAASWNMFTNRKNLKLSIK
ncbi:MAG: hypothetical protein OEY17_03025 [Nitrosopumilus sp.]|nr:hypothetical protein [Nitrosopumilus sp.]MDH5658303.1 hypothetical protein [Nitrosopumilus sp.]